MLTNVFLLLTEFGKEWRRILTFLCAPDTDRHPEAEGERTVASCWLSVSDLRSQLASLG